MHLPDSSVQKGLLCIQSMHFISIMHSMGIKPMTCCCYCYDLHLHLWIWQTHAMYELYESMHSLGIKPMTLLLLTAWTTFACTVCIYRIVLTKKELHCIQCMHFVSSCIPGNSNVMIYYLSCRNITSQVLSYWTCIFKPIIFLEC